MKKKSILAIYLTAIMITIVVITTLTLNHLYPSVSTPEGVLYVSELLANPIYGEQVKVYGKVDALGELLCPCFFLQSGGQSIDVWYDLMDENEIQRPDVSVEGIDNGDWVVVTGELRDGGSFWASSIEKI